eukprot:CAMPEP_0179963490 /NCGR_PEP_ID=MMETSP0983-20121128/30806_1 /TAXON_ID=483367 /ORGANISM="non described non described, Strain CCMP 2436" /LENGTH=52 /DNA_ID=CAMNT_0021876119 /DNA_START=24 /DNA_END=179 /DNA_ORIENTATION=-
MALVGCEAEVASTLFVVLRHALAQAVASPERGLRPSMALVGCEAEVASTLFV